MPGQATGKTAFVSAGGGSFGAVQVGILRELVASDVRADLVDPRGLAALLERHLPCKNLEDAAIPVHVVATSLLAGTAVCFSRGPAIPAILASAAIPAAFPPVWIGDDDYNGGVASNTPVETARALRA